MGIKLSVKKHKVTRDKALKLARSMRHALKTEGDKEWGIYLVTEPKMVPNFLVIDKESALNSPFQIQEVLKPADGEFYKLNGITTQKNFEDVIYGMVNQRLTENYTTNRRQEIIDNHLYPWAKEGVRSKDIEVHVYARLRDIEDGTRSDTTIYRGTLNDDLLVATHNWLNEELPIILGSDYDDVTVDYLGDDLISQEIADGFTDFYIAKIEGYGRIRIVLGERVGDKIKPLNI